MRPQKIFENIERLAYEKGLTVSSLCHKAGMTQGTIFDLKYGRKNTISSQTVEKLCSVLDCTPNDILSINNEEALPDKPSAIELFISRASDQLRERQELRRLMRIAMRSSDKIITAVAMLLEEQEGGE